MNSNPNDVDIELHEWLQTEEDGPALAAVASRISRFAAEKAPSSTFNRQLRSRVFPMPRSSRRRRLLPMAAAASLLLGGIGIGFYLSQPPAQSELAWADVVSAMQPVEHFHVTVFGDNPDPSQKILHFEVYYRHPDLWRAQGMNWIQFGVGEQVRLYGISEGTFLKPSRGNPEFIPKNFAGALNQQGMLDAVVKALFRPHAPPAEHVVNDPALRETGIQVFDYGDKAQGLSARIWVLERSRLPIRLQVNDPERGAITWATIDYSEPRSPDFFDAESFKKSVQAGGPPTTREAFENRFADDPIAAWYKLACQWRQPSTVLKYSENPSDAPATGSKSARNSFNAGPVEKLPYDDGRGGKQLTDWPLIFMHERTSRILGVKRLIAVKRPAENKWPQLVFGIAQIGPQGTTFAIQEEQKHKIDMSGICGPGQIRLYAGQPDEKDDSRFSIPFEANGKKGWIDGVFVGSPRTLPSPYNSSDEVRLSIRLAD